MSFDLAPIGASVYTRFDHFKQCIASLQGNALAGRSDLYIFSDAACVPEDEDLVGEVRDFARNITGFRTIYLTETHVSPSSVGDSPATTREPGKNEERRL